MQSCGGSAWRNKKNKEKEIKPGADAVVAWRDYEGCWSYTGLPFIFFLAFTPPWLFAVPLFYSYPYDKSPPLFAPSPPFDQRYQSVTTAEISAEILGRVAFSIDVTYLGILSHYDWSHSLTAVGTFFSSFRPPSSCNQIVRTVAPKKKRISNPLLWSCIPCDAYR